MTVLLICSKVKLDTEFIEMLVEIKIENAQQKRRFLRAAQAKVEIVMTNSDFPNGKSELS